MFTPLRARAVEVIAFGTPLFLGHCLPLRIRVRDLFDPRAWHILGGDVTLTTRRQEVPVTTLRGTRTKKIIAPLPLHYTPRGQAMSKRALQSIEKPEKVAATR